MKTAMNKWTKKLKINKMFICMAFTLFFSISSSAYAISASSCYSLDEAEAEQGLRIHSELMVIGLNCQHMQRVGGPGLFAKYRNFTSEHEHLFEYYEDKMIGYYRRQGYKNPEKELNNLRTEFANKISNDAARMRPDVFCYRYASRIDQVADLSTSSVRKWASTFYDSHPVSYPICKQ